MILSFSKNILVVDDSKFIRTILKEEISNTIATNYNLFLAASYKETAETIKQNKFHVAILDINLPDAPNGEVIDLLIDQDVPVIVLTGGINETTKKIILNKDIVEYITKSSPHSFGYIVSIIKLILKSYDSKLLVVDNSKTSRALVRSSLQKLHPNILEACSSEEALQTIGKDEEISLVITDYEMSGMNGMELAMELRQKYTKDKLSIIAVSSSNDPNIAASFLRYGANDYVRKPFTDKELNARVNSNLELLDLFQDVKDKSNKDFLTSLYNRRFFYENATSILAKVKRQNLRSAIAMIDIDFLKKINDTYGHGIGDIAIKEIANVLNKHLSNNALIARFGGEEFCILIENISYLELEQKFEQIRDAFEKNIITVNSLTFSYTVSIGIFYGFLDSLEDMINLSDKALYDAKDSGRNKVIIKTV